jgi:hypothetical protein
MNDQYVTFGAAWFTLSLINAGLAQGKGRSGLSWWLASLFVGPFATFLIVAWPAVEPEQRGPEVMSRTMATLVGLAAVLAVVVVVGLLAFAIGSGR